MHFLDYVRIFRRQWMIILTCTGLAAGAAAVLTSQVAPKYAASITLFVSAPGPSVDAVSAYQASLLSQERVKSYADLLRSERISGRLAADVGGGLTAKEVQARISTKVLPDTVLLRATVTDTSAQRAKLLANTLGSAFAELVEVLERPSRGGPSPVKVTVVDSANVSQHPVSPKPVRNLGLGLIVGLLLGVGTGTLRETLDTSVKSLDVLRSITDKPALGVIGFDNAAQKHPLIVQADSKSPRAEAFRSVRTNLQFVDIDQPPRAVVITSSVQHEGKSTTACNLAITMAQAGTRVIVVEGDLRRPRVSNYLGMEGAAGLTNVLVGNAELDDVIQEWGRGLLSVLPSGPIPPNPSELLGSQHMVDILKQLEDRADVVLVDAPPLLPVTDAAILAAICDGALLIVRHGHTRREQLVRAVEQLRAVDGRLLGTVLNMAPGRGGGGYGYGYGYGYSYASDGDDPQGQLRSALGALRRATGRRPGGG